jgi:hypothetical protein
VPQLASFVHEDEKGASGAETRRSETPKHSFSRFYAKSREPPFRATL